MSWQTKAITVFFGLLLIFVEIYLLKKRRLEPEYALLWLLTGLVLIVLALWENLLLAITYLIGAKLAASMVFFFSLIFLGTISLHYSIKITQLEHKVKRLTQELSILKDKDKNEQETPSQEPLA